MQGDPCMKCGIEGEKLYCLHEDFPNFEVCRDCGMKFHAEYTVFANEFMRHRKENNILK